MFDFIRRAGRPVSRDEASTAVGISRKLAAFHLDKLVDVGLLRASYGASGAARRVGRNPKLYEPTGNDVVVAIPRRQHEFLAGVLTEAVVNDTEGGSAARTAIRTAWERGEQLGASERARARPGRLGAERAITLAEQVLHGCGFEPARHAATCLRLRDCPFHPLASTAPELVCRINHAFLAGLLAGLRASTVAAVLDPRAGECCVELRPAVRPQRSDG